MTTALTIATAAIAILALLYFFGSQMGMKLFHTLSIATITGAAEAKRQAHPDQSLASIYRSIAEERNKRLEWLQAGNYLNILSELGCFDEANSVTPEEFAKISADTEYLIKCSTAEKKFPGKHS